MAKKTKNLTHLETVVHTESMQQARQYENILTASDIPVVINEHSDYDHDGIAVMVPEQFFDEALVIIESEKCCNDFYYADEDDDSFNDDFLDDYSNEL
ncbi:MAG: hypothetical protein PHF37_03025 [Phycisphaerae bacterium]|nr:hypothetical protein [Phycisphaerae bacterium]